MLSGPTRENRKGGGRKRCERRRRREEMRWRRTEKATERAGADDIHRSGLEVDEDDTGDVLAGGSLSSRGGEEEKMRVKGCCRRSKERRRTSLK
jgi:hypothetical protein